MGAAVTALATAALAPAAGASSACALTELARVVTLAAPQISPDGRHAVAVISRIELAAGAHRALTSERNAVWSPDGHRGISPQRIVLGMDSSGSRFRVGRTAA